MIQHFLFWFIWTAFFPIILLFGPELFAQFSATHQIANLHSATCAVTFSCWWLRIPAKKNSWYIYNIYKYIFIYLCNNEYIYTSISEYIFVHIDIRKLYASQMMRKIHGFRDHPQTNRQPIRWRWIEHPGARRQVAWDIESIFYHLVGRFGFVGSVGFFRDGGAPYHFHKNP